MSEPLQARVDTWIAADVSWDSTGIMGQMQAVIRELEAERQRLLQEVDLEHRAHQHTIDTERICGRVLVMLTGEVGVPEGSSFVEEVRKLIEIRDASVSASSQR